MKGAFTVAIIECFIRKVLIAIIDARVVSMIHVTADCFAFIFPPSKHIATLTKIQACPISRRRIGNICKSPI
jgi:hypothetical protein